ncbi:MAG: cytochrome c [Segetibacter sp.]
MDDDGGGITATFKEGSSVTYTIVLPRIMRQFLLLHPFATLPVKLLMKKRFIVILSAVLLLLYFNACNSGRSAGNSSISSDSATIAKGEASFNQHCSGCHNFRQDGIGPQLGGLTTKASADWIQHFIKDPQKVINSGDQHAQQLYKKYKVMMPSFAALTDDELNGIISFLNIHKLPNQKVAKVNGKELSNPIPETIKPSNMVVSLELVTQIPPSSDSGKLPLARITKLDFQPNTGSSFILDLNGKLYKIQHDKPMVYMDMARLKPNFIHEPGLATGFGSFAFHPNSPETGLFTLHIPNLLVQPKPILVMQILLR